MTKRYPDNIAGGFLLLLLLLLLLPALKEAFRLSGSDRNYGNNRIYVQVSGDVVQPGVYAFMRPPDLKGLLIRAGGLHAETEKCLPFTERLFCSGAKVDVKRNATGYHILEGDMSAFYKVTLGVPVSINRETVEGLASISGIGLKIGRSIILERNRRGGFESLDELLSVQGIGPALYRKISPYLKVDTCDSI